MKLVQSTFEEFGDYVKKNNTSIIFFGAGAIGKVLIPYICNLHELDNNVLGYVDNNPSKQGERVSLCSRQVGIHSINWLETRVDNNTVLVITNGDFASSIAQLDRLDCLRDTICFLAPVMQLMNKGNAGVITHSFNEPVIPKRIHYCWFSGNPIPEKLQRCIASWKEMCPDYEIIRWDESNYDLSKYRYTQQAFDSKKWAFIPDIVRLDVLYEYGGFYFDTDVEIIRNLDDLRYQDAFCGREEWGHVNFGGGSGCRKNFELIKEILVFRKDEPFIREDGSFNTEASGYYETTPLVRRGLHIENTTEIIDGMTIYSAEYFSPYNYGSGTENITENTFSIHYFSGGWLGEEGNQYRKETRMKYSQIVSSMAPFFTK